MEKSEIKATFLGQTVGHYSSWNGGYNSFLVKKVELKDGYVALRGEAPLDVVSIDYDMIDELVIARRAERHTEIDHCTVTDSYELLPNRDDLFKKEIEDTKQQIKELKKKLKAQQTDYENFLVSSIRIGVLENAAQLLTDEFDELSSQLESMTFDEVMDTYCTLGESDNEIQLDVSGCGWEYIVAVYIDVPSGGVVKVSPENVIINSGNGKTRNVNINKFLNNNKN